MLDRDKRPIGYSSIPQGRELGDGVGRTLPSLAQQSRGLSSAPQGREIPPAPYGWDSHAAASARPRPAADKAAAFGGRSRRGASGIGLFLGMLAIFALLGALGYFTYVESPFSPGIPVPGGTPVIHWGSR